MAPKTLSIVVVLLILICLVSAYFLYSSFWPGYTQAKQNLASTQEKNATLKEALAGMQVFLQDFKQQGKNAALINLALPKGDSDAPNLLNSLSNTAQESGVILSNFQINEGQNGAGAKTNAIQTEDLTMSATANNYASFKDFLQRLEQHLRLVDINHIILSSVGDASTAASPGLQYQVQMRTYYQE